MLTTTQQDAIRMNDHGKYLKYKREIMEMDERSAARLAAQDDQISEDLWTEIMIDEADRVYWRHPNGAV